MRPSKNVLRIEPQALHLPGAAHRRVPAVHAPHLRRCLDAGLLEPAADAKGAWRLSAAGVAALAARRVRRPSGFAGFLPQFLNRELLAQTMTVALAAGALSSAESVLFLWCWDRPSTVADALAALGMPRVFAEALTPGVFTVGDAPETYTLARLLRAESARLMPADVTAIAALAQGEVHALHHRGGVLVRRVGEPPRQPCSAFARRLSNILTIYGKVLGAGTQGGAS